MPTLERPRETRPEDHDDEAVERFADRAWAVARRIHLGTRKPSNWIQLVKFAAVGGSGYAINLAVFALLAGALGLHHLVAAVGAFGVAVSSNFYWNRHWTFAAGSGSTGFQAPRFFAVSIVALAVNLVLLELLVSADVAELVAQAIAVALSMPVNFIGNKLWTFGAHAS